MPPGAPAVWGGEAEGISTRSAEGGRDARPPEGGLRRDALGLLGTIALTAAYMAPAGSLIALFGPIVAKTGPAAAVVHSGST